MPLLPAVRAAIRCRALAVETQGVGPLKSAVSLTNQIITLTQYINHRLGSAPKEQAINCLAKPFGAGSLAGLWQYWNPVWNYCHFLSHPERSHGGTY